MMKQSKIPIWLVSSEGEVYSKHSNKILKPYLRKGYESLKYKGKHYTVHKLVAEVFIGDIEDGMCVNHIDGNKRNNSISNLEIITYKENLKHAIDNGLRRKIQRSKLNDDSARELITDIIKGIDDETNALKYNISPYTVRNIRRKQSWKHIWDSM